MTRLRIALWIGFSVAISSAVAGAQSDVPAPPVRSVMADDLARIAREANPRQNPFLNERRIEMFRRDVAAAKQAGLKFVTSIKVAGELLRAGRTEEAIRQLTAIRRILEAPATKGAESFIGNVLDLLAVAYLRLAEQENCVAHHGIDSCLMPIQGTGVHQITRGSERAFQEYAALLARAPQRLANRWLLNLAAMTLGRHPEGVPASWRIPPSVFASDHDPGRFFDVSSRLGVDVVGLSGGCVVEDLDGDGLLDIVASSWGLMDPIRYFHNRGDGGFEEWTGRSGLVGEVSGLNINHADYDNDGDADLLILRGAWLGEEGLHPASLLRNNGDGTFRNVTREAGLYSLHPSQTAAWGDFDGDGWLDLFMGNETSGDVPHPCELYLNQGDGTFREVAAQVGLDVVGYVKGTAWGDVDNDGRIDLYLSRFGQPNLLFENAGPRPGENGEWGWGFNDVTAGAGVAEPQKSFPTWFWDYDNDGDLDLFVATYPTFKGLTLDAVVADYLGKKHPLERSRLYRNRGDGTFEDVSVAANIPGALIAMGSNFGDLDNDGWLDCYIGTGQPNLRCLVPNRMLRNAAGKSFQDVTTAGGFGHIQKGHGVAFADIDNDGDQDIYAVLGGAFSGDVYQNALFLNPGHGHRWITLRLEGTRSNRSAIGARVRVRVEAPAGPRDIHVVVGTGGSFGSASLQQEIGLGDATKIAQIEIRWPSPGEVQKLGSLDLDRVYHLRQGEAPRPLALPIIDLSGATTRPK